MNLQCEEDAEQTPQHTQIDFIDKWEEIVITFGNCVNYGRVQAEIYEPLILDKVS